MWDEYYGIASTPTDDYLAHYGVLGMKWGVRKLNKYKGSLKDRAIYDDGIKQEFSKAAQKLNKLSKNKGSLRYKRFRNAMVDAFKYTDYSNQDNDKTRALDKQMLKIEDDYWKSPKRDKIIRQLAKRDAKKYGGSFKDHYYGYKYDDLDQGEGFQRYLNLKENKKLKARYNRALNNRIKELHKLQKEPSY